MATLMNGKETSALIRSKISEKIKQLKERNIEIGLSAIVIGNDGGSSAYINNISKVCNETFVKFDLYKFEDLSQNKLIELINRLNADNKVHGIIIQLPLPKHIDTDLISRTISQNKDIDCFNPINMGKLFRGEKCLLPCTPKGIIRLLQAYNIEIEGKKVAIVGRSNIVGKPIAMLMLNKNATVTICHSKTKNLEKELCDKDIIISAVGCPKLISNKMVKTDAVVIDAGTTYIDGSLQGDVDFDKVFEKASFITPVPGGVGSMTTTMLIENVLEASGYDE